MGTQSTAQLNSEFIFQTLGKTHNQYGKLNELSEAQRKAGERRAIEKTLIDSGYLVVKRRRITPQVYEKNRTNLT